jgi:hypothetical protein
MPVQTQDATEETIKLQLKIKELEKILDEITTMAMRMIELRFQTKG